MVYRFIAHLGNIVLYFICELGRMGTFLFSSCLGLCKRPFRHGALVEQLRQIGASSFLLIFFTGGFTGMVLGLQGFYTLRKFGAEGMLGSAVGLSLIREMGPVLTGLMVTGRAGSAMCAEIGIMRNTEQIDALECMAIDPFRYIMAPKFLATIISVPLLTFVFNVVGIFGGYLAGVKMLGINGGSYFESMQHSVLHDDIRLGVIKSFVFAVLIVWICSSRGYYVHEARKAGFGAKAVSKVTTRAVVMASISILVWDFLITAMFL